MKEIVLASASPRRKELLAQIGLEFTVIPSRADEIITKNIPSEVVEELSCQKAEDVAAHLPENKKDSIVIGADTIVSQNGCIMGKPVDREDAKRMLLMLQGNTHSVFTGVTILDRTARKQITFSCETKVHVYPMSDEEIEKYLDSGEPMDKAGAYGIQGMYGAWVKSIEGDYNNVVGLPVSALWQKLKEFR